MRILRRSHGLSKDQASAIRDEHDINQEYADGEDDNMDMEARQKIYPSEMTPQDYFQYKKLRIIPDAGTDFPGLIDKDTVLANVSGARPDLQNTKFVVETIELFHNVFVVEQLVPVLEQDGRPKLDEHGDMYVRKSLMFDKTFEPIVRTLLAGIKFELTGSRAMGRDREAVLDISQNISKNIMRKKDNENKILGLGVK